MQSVDILKAAKLYFNKDITLQIRKPEYSHPRFIVCKVLKDKGLSYPKIANRVGLQDHTSVMHGIKRVNENEALQAAYNGFMEYLNNDS